jgi:transposase-like protein
VDETYVKVAGRWAYLYRAVDQFGQVIYVYASARRDSEAARRFFQRTRTSTGVVPVEVITDRAPTYPRSSMRCGQRRGTTSSGTPTTASKSTTHSSNGGYTRCTEVKTMTGLRAVAGGHAFVQNLRRGHYEIAADQPCNRRLPVAFRELAKAI